MFYFAIFLKDEILLQVSVKINSFLNFKGVLNNFEYHRFAACIQKRYGDFVKLRIKNKRALFVFHPDTAKEILLKKSKYPITGSLEVYRVYNEQKKLHPPMISL